jgi:protein-tyrosine phosphatase
MIKKILFVCSGNIFRSVTAEHCLKKYLRENNIKGWSVSSSGTSEDASLKYPYFVEKMCEMSMGDVTKHKRRQLIKEHLDNSDFVIAMAPYHVHFIKEKFNNTDVYLFTELVGDGSSGVYDIGEIEGDVRTKDEVIDDTIDYICSRTPDLFRTLSEI